MAEVTATWPFPACGSPEGACPRRAGRPPAESREPRLSRRCHSLDSKVLREGCASRQTGPGSNARGSGRRAQAGGHRLAGNGWGPQGSSALSLSYTQSLNTFAQGLSTPSTRGLEAAQAQWRSSAQGLASGRWEPSRRGSLCSLGTFKGAIDPSCCQRQRIKNKFKYM